MKLCAAVALSIAVLASLVVLPVPHSAHATTKIFGVQDICIVTYPEFLELMMDGEVTVTDDDLTVHLVKDECGWHYLQRLSILVKAE